MIGEVVGNRIGKNRDGTQNVRILQVRITDDDDIQDAELYGPIGDDSVPVDGSLAFIFSIGDNWKIAIGLNDNIVPVSLSGEKELYSILNGAKKAKHKLGTDEIHTFNDGTKQAARKDDSIISTPTEDSTFWTWVSAVATATGVTPPPTSLTGKINQGTDKVLLP